MKRKAQLDLLDINAHDNAAMESGEGVPTTSHDKQVSGIKMGKLVVAATATAAVIVVISIALWYFYLHTQRIEPSFKQAGAPLTKVQDPSGPVSLDDFFIAVRDDRGNIRILSCGFVLETESGKQKEWAAKQADLRRFIYETVAKRTVSELLDTQGKKALKKEIQDGLEALLGKGTIKTVYLSKYTVL